MTPLDDPTLDATTGAAAAGSKIDLKTLHDLNVERTLQETQTRLVDPASLGKGALDPVVKHARSERLEQAA